MFGLFPALALVHEAAVNVRVPAFGGDPVPSSSSPYLPVDLLGHAIIQCLSPLLTQPRGLGEATGIQ